MTLTPTPPLPAARCGNVSPNICCAPHTVPCTPLLFAHPLPLITVTCMPRCAALAFLPAPNRRHRFCATCPIPPIRCSSLPNGRKALTRHKLACSSFEPSSTHLHPHGVASPCCPFLALSPGRLRLNPHFASPPDTRTLLPHPALSPRMCTVPCGNQPIAVRSFTAPHPMLVGALSQLPTYHQLFHAAHASTLPGHSALGQSSHAISLPLPPQFGLRTLGCMPFSPAPLMNGTPRVCAAILQAANARSRHARQVSAVCGRCLAGARTHLWQLLLWPAMHS